MNFIEIRRQLRSVRDNSKTSFNALCPAHEDEKQSLTVTNSGDRLLLFCHAGCQVDEICSALNITARDLFFSTSNGHGKQMVAECDYRDEQNELLYQAVRFVPKDFRQRRPDGRGGWIWNLEGVKRVPYRLPELLADSAGAVFIVEGERDVDNLRSLGFVATCNVGGAGKWRDEYSEFLRGRDVVILPDNDIPGRKHGFQVANSLYGVASSIRVLALPDLLPKGDISDWLAVGNDGTDLMVLLDGAEYFEPTAEQPQPPESEIDECNDLGNARRFVLQHGRDMRYCVEQHRWYVFDGKRWAPDLTLEAQRRAKETARLIAAEAATAPDKNFDKLLRHAQRSKSARAIKDMLKLVESDLAVSASDFDRDLWLLNCKNGTLSLRTGQLQDHRRQDFIAKLINVDYDPQAICPKWLEFLDRIMGGNEGLISFLRRAIGYSLTGQVTERAVFILFGSGANGKSVFIEIFLRLLGDYATVAPSSTIMKRQQNGASNDIAKLHQVRFVSLNESDQDARLDEAVIKGMSGDDTLTARFLYAEFFDFKPEFKIWLRTNHKPIVRGTDSGIWDRLKLIPFAVRIPPAEQDKKLKDKLLRELPGILAWAVAGCLEWQRDGLGVVEEIETATNKYRDEQNIFSQFVGETCVVSATAWTSSAVLRLEYESFCKERGEIPLVGNAFSERLTALGCESKSGRDSGKVVRGWRGIGVLDDRC